jgi:hypothetical protein
MVRRREGEEAETMYLPQDDLEGLLGDARATLLVPGDLVKYFFRFNARLRIWDPNDTLTRLYPRDQTI